MNEPTFSGRQPKRRPDKPRGKHRRARPVGLPWRIAGATAGSIVFISLVVLGWGNAVRPSEAAYQAALGPTETQVIADSVAAEQQARAEAEAASAEYERLWIENIRELSRQQQAEMELREQLAAEAEAEAKTAAEAAKQPALAPPVSSDGGILLVDDQTQARAIDIYLTEKDSPLVGYGRAFVSAGKTFGVDPFLVVAIMGKESSWGKYCFLPYNGWGWGDVSFKDWEDAIFGYTRMLAEEYIRKGRTDINIIAPIYCPPSNGSWARDVAAFYNELVLIQAALRR